MKVLFVDSAHASLHTSLEAAGYVCDLVYNHTRESLLSAISDYDGVVIRSKIKLDREIISAGKRLRFIARVGAGMENIDVDFATSCGVTCFHAPEGNRDAVAEHAMGMLLALQNNICRADAQVRKGLWIREGNRGTEIMGKTVAIIGFGNMGEAFSKRLAGFGCRVIAHDKYRKAFENSLVKEVELETVFHDADIVSLHVPLTEETEFMVNTEFLNRFRKPIILINTARGKVLNTSDLVAAMQQGKVAGACLDVLEYEEGSFEDLSEGFRQEAFQFLAKSERVVLSPHVGGWTHESNEKLAQTLVNKIVTKFGTFN